MARVMEHGQFSTLKPGAHVWVESVMDDGETTEYEVVEDHGFSKTMVSVDTPQQLSRTYDFQRATGVRFWDGRPDLTEALSTPWFRARRE